MGVTGTELIAELPAGPGLADIAQREQRMLRAVREGDVVFALHELVLGDRLVVRVMADALRWGSEQDCVRLPVSCKLQQAIADRLDMLLLTPALCDGIWRVANVRLGPHTQPVRREMTGLAAALEHHQALEKERAGRGGLIAGWKDWCLGRPLWWASGRALNYGWHTEVGGFAAVTPGLRVLQRAATAHGRRHVDYSQLCRLVMRAAVLDGGDVDLGEIYRGAHGADVIALVSHEGALRGWRLP